MLASGWGGEASQGQRGSHRDPGREQGDIRRAPAHHPLLREYVCGCVEIRVCEHFTAPVAAWHTILVNMRVCVPTRVSQQPHVCVKGVAFKIFEARGNLVIILGIIQPRPSSERETIASDPSGSILAEGKKYLLQTLLCFYNPRLKISF